MKDITAILTNGIVTVPTGNEFCGTIKGGDLPVAVHGKNAISNTINDEVVFYA